MPYIHSKISVPSSPLQQERLKAALGKHIQIFRGKSEKGLMLELTDNCQMYHGGEKLPGIACVQVKLLGSQPKECYLEFTRKICETYEQIFQIPARHVYIIYETATAWGCDYENS